MPRLSLGLGSLALLAGIVAGCGEKEIPIVNPAEPVATPPLDPGDPASKASPRSSGR